jgi:hypothetical protein
MGLRDATSNLRGAIISPNGNISEKQLSLQPLRRKSWRLQNQHWDEGRAISFYLASNFHYDLQAGRDCGVSRTRAKFQCDKFLHFLQSRNTAVSPAIMQHKETGTSTALLPCDKPDASATGWPELHLMEAAQEWSPFFEIRRPSARRDFDAT